MVEVTVTDPWIFPNWISFLLRIGALLGTWTIKGRTPGWACCVWLIAIPSFDSLLSIFVVEVYSPIIELYPVEVVKFGLFWVGWLTVDFNPTLAVGGYSAKVAPSFEFLFSVLESEVE